MKIFNDVSSLAAASLTANQIVKVKGVGDYQIKDSGAGITLANGKIAVPQASGTAISVKQFGAVGDGVADDTAAIQAALASLTGETLLFPSGDYKVTATLSLDGLSNSDIRFDSDARILAGVNSLTVFQSSTNAWGVKIFDAHIDGNGFTGVTGFDLIRLEQLGAGLFRPVLRNLDSGIFLRSLCTGAIIDTPDINNVNSPIVLVDGAGGIQINHPCIDTFNLIGIDIRTAVSFGNVGVQILGGYIQNGAVGIKDSATATNITGTYFETCTVADIELSTSFYATVSATNHTSTGVVAVKARNSDGARVFNPFMSSGARSTGLFDFDNTNTNCVAEYLVGASSQNAPAGVTTGINLYTPIEGTFTPIVSGSSVAGAGTYSVQTGYYQKVGKYVHVNMKIVWTAHTGSGNMYVNVPVLGNYVAAQQAPIVGYNFSFTGPILAAGFTGNDLYIYNYATTGTVSLVSLPSAGALVINTTYKLS